MRVLTLSNMYPPHHYGGYELSCRDVMERFRARGHDVTVLTTTMRVPGVVDDPGERARGILRDLVFYWDDHRLVSPPLWRRASLERQNHSALLSAIEACRPDVVSVWNMGAMSLGLLTTIRRRNIPMVLAVCDDWLVYGVKLDPWSRLFARAPWLAPPARAIAQVPAGIPDLREADAFCFVSDHVRRRAQTSAWTTIGRSTIVYSGIDTRDFPPAVPPSHGWAGRLLYAGRLDERKGIHVAVDALHELPDAVTLDIVGRGDSAYRDRLDTLIAGAGLRSRVRFADVPREELRARYAAADAFVFPVLWDEPFGLVPVEAMACGLPVIATGTGGSAEFLAHERNCLIVPPNDPRAIATAVQRLESDAALRARLIEGGLRTARILTVDRLADAFEEWHLTAAQHFANGVPTDRPSPLAEAGLTAPAGSPR